MNGEFEDNRSYYYLFAKYWIVLWKMGIFLHFLLRLLSLYFYFVS